VVPLAGAAAPRLNPLAAAERDAAARAVIESFATWDGLARDLSARQLLDVLFTAGACRSVSYALNSTGVQLDENMADFRFPPDLRWYVKMARR
jgi:hypothetical protein